MFNSKWLSFLKLVNQYHLKYWKKRCGFLDISKGLLAVMMFIPFVITKFWPRLFNTLSKLFCNLSNQIRNVLEITLALILKRGPYRVIFSFIMLFYRWNIITRITDWSLHTPHRRLLKYWVLWLLSLDWFCGLVELFFTWHREIQNELQI